MTQTETSQVLKLIKIAYPHSFSKLTKEDMIAMLKLWTNSFKADALPEVYRAAREYIMVGKFAPTIADIRERMTVMQPSGDSAVIEQQFSNNWMSELGLIEEAII